MPLVLKLIQFLKEETESFDLHFKTNLFLPSSAQVPAQAGLSWSYFQLNPDPTLPVRPDPIQNSTY